MQNTNAALFIQTLTGNIETPMAWRALYPKDRMPPGGIPARKLRGPLSSVLPALTELNKQGYGIFVTVNECNASGQSAAHITRVRALFVDSDNGTLPDTLPLPPAIRVRYGRGEHLYWLVSDSDAKRAFAGAQTALADEFMTDPSIHDLPRIMRVPGFKWTKPTDSNEWLDVPIEVSNTPAMPVSAILRTLRSPPSPPTPAWGQYRLALGIRRIQLAQEGTRNNILNAVAFETKDLIRCSLLDASSSRNALLAAAEAIGLSYAESDTTISSAFSAPSKENIEILTGDSEPLPPGVEDVASVLIRRWGGAERVAVVGEVLHRYDETKGLWASLPLTELRAEIATLHGQPCYGRKGSIERFDITPKRRNEIADALLHRQGVRRPLEFWTSAQMGLTFSDGFLSVADGRIGTLSPLSADTRARWALPMRWADSEGGCPLWLAWLDDIWADANGDDRAQRVQALGEWLGSALLGQSPRWCRALFLWGPGGSNGKSVMLSVLERLVPPSMRTTVPLGEWGKEYSRAFLAPPAVLNIVAEIEKSELIHSAAFKSIISGDSIIARAPYQPPSVFRPVAGHVLSCNDLPATKDVGGGFWRRLLILPFFRQFDGTLAAEELTNALAGESASIVRWALELAAGALASGRLLVPAVSDAVRSDWADDVDSVRGWLSANEDALADWTSGQTAYDQYRVWCQMSGLPPCSLPVWARRLEAMADKRRVVKARQYKRRG